MLRERDPFCCACRGWHLHKRTLHAGWGQMGQAQGGSPRQWDEFMMDTGTAGDSWHAMFVHTVECHGQGRKEGRTDIKMGIQKRLPNCFQY